MMGLGTAFDLLEVSACGPVGVKRRRIDMDIEKQGSQATVQPELHQKSFVGILLLTTLGDEICTKSGHLSCLALRWASLLR